MDVFEKICLEMVDKVEELATSGYTAEILEYIKEKKKQVENCRKMSKNERQIH